MIGLSIDVPSKDLKAFQGALARYVEHIPGGIKKAVEKAAVKVVLALRASTKTSRKTRKVVDNPLRAKIGKRQQEKSDKAHKHIEDWYAVHPHANTGRKVKWLKMATKDNQPKWSVEKWRDGQMTPRPIQGAKTKGEANKSKAREIARRGLADKAWFWAMKDIGRGSAGRQGQDVPENLRDKSMKVSRIFSKSIAQLTIHNKLRYAQQAFGGASPVSGAIDRARKMLEFEMLDAAGKAAVKAGLRTIT